MTRFLAACVFFPTFALLVVLAGLVAVLRGLCAAIAWVSDLATPLVLGMAEIADGGRREDHE